MKRICMTHSLLLLVAGALVVNIAAYVPEENMRAAFKVNVRALLKNPNDASAAAKLQELYEKARDNSVLHKNFENALQVLQNNKNAKLKTFIDQKVAGIARNAPVHSTPEKIGEAIQAVEGVVHIIEAQAPYGNNQTIKGEKQVLEQAKQALNDVKKQVNGSNLPAADKDKLNKQIGEAQQEVILAQDVVDTKKAELEANPAHISKQEEQQQAEELAAAKEVLIVIKDEVIETLAVAKVEVAEFQKETAAAAIEKYKDLKDKPAIEAAFAELKKVVDTAYDHANKKFEVDLFPFWLGLWYRIDALLDKASEPSFKLYGYLYNDKLIREINAEKAIIENGMAVSAKDVSAQLKQLRPILKKADSQIKAWYTLAQSPAAKDKEAEHAAALEEIKKACSIDIQAASAIYNKIDKTAVVENASLQGEYVSYGHFIELLKAASIVLQEFSPANWAIAHELAYGNAYESPSKYADKLHGIAAHLANIKDKLAPYTVVINNRAKDRVSIYWIPGANYAEKLFDDLAPAVEDLMVVPVLNKDDEKDWDREKVVAYLKSKITSMNSVTAKAKKALKDYLAHTITKDALKDIHTELATRKPDKLYAGLSSPLPSIYEGPADVLEKIGKVVGAPQGNGIPKAPPLPPVKENNPKPAPAGGNIQHADAQKVIAAVARGDKASLESLRKLAEDIDLTEMSVEDQAHVKAAYAAAIQKAKALGEGTLAGLLQTSMKTL